MRKLYISTKTAWFASHQAGHFHPISGSAYLDLEGGLILVSAELNGEAGEEGFTSNPDVAALPDPIFEGTVKMKDHVGKPSKKYTQAHHDALRATLGVTDEDTVMEVGAKAQARYKAVRISHNL